MDYSYLVKGKVPDFAKLQKFGFVPDGDKLSYRRDLPNGLFVQVEIVGDVLDVEVFDSIYNEKYLPFRSGHGGSAIKSEVRFLLDEIIARGYSSQNVRAQVEGYLQTKYGTQPEYPWDDLPLYSTYKTPRKQKWYALFMSIKAMQIGLIGDQLVDVVNLKVAPERIAEVVDGKQIFPAYHMNKKYWITVLLDMGTDKLQLYELLDESFNIVEYKK